MRDRALDRSQVEGIKRRLSDAVEVARLLGLLAGAERQSRGLVVRCPAHDDQWPSCSIRIGDDGTLAVRCHAASCELSGDVFDLIAAVERLDRDRDFVAVKHRAAALARIDIDVYAPHKLPPPAPPRRRRGFPPAQEVRDLWDACVPCSRDPEVAAWLSTRAIDAANVDLFGLARAMPPEMVAPRWAGYRGSSWAALGYRCIFPMYDCSGDMRSVRARCVAPRAALPKSLPPGGYATSGLVMLNPMGVMLMQIASWRASGTLDAREHGGDGWPAWAERRVLILEGEPDFLVWAAREPKPSPIAMMGIAGSGQWTDEIARRIPNGAAVTLRTHEDDAGDFYAAQIAASLGGRCTVRESDPAGRAERRRIRDERQSARSRKAH